LRAAEPNGHPAWWKGLVWDLPIRDLVSFCNNTREIAGFYNSSELGICVVTLEKSFIEGKEVLLGGGSLLPRDRSMHGKTISR
jgi:hypothetical protein